jgi:hypothetical protein
MKNQALAILGGAVIIAAAILFVFRWEMAPFGQVAALRLDRWTGKILVCLPPHGEPPTNPRFLFNLGGSLPVFCEKQSEPGK